MRTNGVSVALRGEGPLRAPALHSTRPKARALQLGTVNLGAQNQVREYLRDSPALTFDTAVVTSNSPASFKKLALVGPEGPVALNALVSEFQAGWLRSVVFFEQ